MTMYFPEGKVTDIVDLCKKLLSEKNTTQRELASLIGKLISKYQAVRLASLHCHSLQIYQTTKLRTNLFLGGQKKSKCGLIRRTKVAVPQSELEQRKTYKSSKCGHYNSVGCSKIRLLGEQYQGMTAEGQWSKEEVQFHMNVLQMKAVKLVTESFFRVKKPK